MVIGVGRVVRIDGRFLLAPQPVYEQEEHDRKGDEEVGGGGEGAEEARRVGGGHDHVCGMVHSVLLPCWLWSRHDKRRAESWDSAQWERRGVVSPAGRRSRGWQGLSTA